MSPETVSISQVQGTVTMPTPALADFKFEIPSKAKLGNFFIFYAADLISPEIKSKVPDWKAGGILRESVCLKYRLGFIRKCEITQLRPFMDSTHINNVSPAKRENMITTYQIIENGKSRTIGLTERDGNLVHDGLLRMQFYPVDEINRLTGQVDGVVQMPVATVQEAFEAQYFLFPDWDKIQSGETKLPVKIVDLEKHFKSRLRYDEQNNCI